jgi:hypothetical protein
VSTRATALPLAEEVRPARSETWIFLRRLARRRTSLFGLLVVSAVLLTALGAGVLMPFDPIEQDIASGATSSPASCSGRGRPCSSGSRRWPSRGCSAW